MPQGWCLFRGPLRWVPDPAFLLCPRELCGSPGSDLAWGGLGASAWKRCPGALSVLVPGLGASGIPGGLWGWCLAGVPHGSAVLVHSPASSSNPGVPCSQPVPGEPWVPVPRAGTCSRCSVSASAWPGCISGSHGVSWSRFLAGMSYESTVLVPGPAFSGNPGAPCPDTSARGALGARAPSWCPFPLLCQC